MFLIYLSALATFMKEFARVANVAESIKLTILTDYVKRDIVWLHDFWLFLFWLNETTTKKHPQLSYFIRRTHHFDVIKWSGASIMINFSELAIFHCLYYTVVFAVNSKTIAHFLHSLDYLSFFFSIESHLNTIESLWSCPMPIERNRIALIYSFFFCVLFHQ